MTMKSGAEIRQTPLYKRMDSNPKNPKLLRFRPFKKIWMEKVHKLTVYDDRGVEYDYQCFRPSEEKEDYFVEIPFK